MSTTQVAAALYQLQLLDIELDRLQTEAQTLATALQGHTRLQRARKEHHLAQQQLQAGLQAQKDTEWTLDDISRRLRFQEQRLYSGNVTNPKELQTLQLEVQRLHAQHNRQEELALETLDAVESLQEMAQRKEAALKQAEEAWQQESLALTARNEQLSTRRLELQEKRERLLANLQPDLLRRYEAVRRTRQGRAVSLVEQNACQWCRVTLTSGELQRLRVGSELQTCTNCGRILYYDR